MRTLLIFFVGLVLMSSALAVPTDITDLSAERVGASIVLSWTASGDEGVAVGGYQVRYAGSEDTILGWGSAFVISSGSCYLPIGAAPGSAQSCSVRAEDIPEVDFNNPAYFRMVPFSGSIDVSAVFGPLSNVAFVDVYSSSLADRDFNGNGVIDVGDLLFIVNNLGRFPGDIGFNVSADINRDGAVNVYDLVLVSRDFGKSVDLVAPVASILLPASDYVFSSGTSSTLLSVSTNEPATCRWSASDQAYEIMPSVNVLSGSGTQLHSVTLSGLSAGESYTRFVRCIDVSGNSMPGSVFVSFSVAPEFGFVIVSPSPGQVFSVGTSSVPLSVSTSLSAQRCEWSSSSGFSSVTALSGGPVLFSGSFSGLTTGMNTRYVRCRETSSSAWVSSSVSFTLLSGAVAVDGVCGARATTYSSSTTDWPGGSEYCSQGVASVGPLFPAQGQSVTWDCVGSDGGSTVSCTATRQTSTPPPTSAALFSSNWSTATGLGTPAVMDGGLWNEWYCGEFLSGTQTRRRVLEVVPGNAFGWTHTPNILQVTMRGEDCGQLEERTRVPQGVDYYVRSYIMVLDALHNSNNHPYKTSFSGSQGVMLWAIRNPTGLGGTYRPAIRAIPSQWTDPAVNQVYTIHFLGPQLNQGQWYRFEHKIEYVGDPSLGRTRVFPRVYDSSGQLVADENNFYWEEAQKTLAQSYASGAYRQHPQWEGSVYNSITRINLGYEGPGGSPNGEERYFFAGLEIRTDTWPGPIS